MSRGGYRPNSGPAKGTKYKKKGESIKPKKKQPKTDIPQDIIDEAKTKNLEPLDYMLKVMNDITAEDARRDRMAVSAAPFIHSRKGEGKSKKEEQDDKAKKAGSGKFRRMVTPLKAVK